MIGHDNYSGEILWKCTPPPPTHENFSPVRCSYEREREREKERENHNNYVKFYLILLFLLFYSELFIIALLSNSTRENRLFKFLEPSGEKQTILFYVQMKSRN